MLFVQIKQRFPEQIWRRFILSSARYNLFTKKRLEGEKLPPTKEAFGFHLSRAFFQLSIWSSACAAHANHLNPLHYGWQLEDDILTGTMTEQNIAPLEVVELVACKCTSKYIQGALTPYGLPVQQNLCNLGVNRYFYDKI